MPPSTADRWSLLLRQVTIHDHRQLSQYAPTCLQRLQSSIDRLNGAVDDPADVRDHKSARRPLHRQSHPAREQGLRLAVQCGEHGKVAQQIDVDVPGPALGQNGIDRAMGFDQLGCLSGADPQHDPTAALPDRFRGLNKAHLVVGGIEDEVDTLAVGQLRDFRRDVVAPVVENVMRAGLPGECN